MRKIYSVPEIALKVTPIAEEYNFDNLYLFGSYARGEASIGSDVDFYIDNSKRLVGLFNLSGFLVKAKKALKRQCDIVTSDSIQNNSHFESNLQKEKVLLYERKGR